MFNLPHKIILSTQVAAALQNGLPVVALESTVLTHGLPYPQNLSIFHDLEDILRQANVTPATIIVLNGKAHIGLEDTDMEALTPLLQDLKGFQKLGMRDLALALSQRGHGGTTVSATMQLASVCGIEVFATGGIGGVHRNWQQTNDISSDLTALSEIPVAVVSAGCKAILDVPATLEYLETLAVPLLGWQTDSFPLFYTRESGFPVDRIDSAQEFAAFWKQHLSLGGKGVLIANPIPAEHSIPAANLEPVIQSAIRSARSNGVSGKAITPFLLDYLAQHTKGDSIEANISLLRNNVRLAANLAKALKS